MSRNHKGLMSYNKFAKPFLLLGYCLLLITGVSAQSDHTLWYHQPAQYFEESLVLGNGKMGASVFGGIHSDKIYLNDATLWSGEPVNANMNPEAYKNLAAVRAALKNESYKLADSLNHKLQGKFSESYAPLGTMYIDFKHHNAEHYYRELNISESISRVSYEVKGIKYTREYFISHPDQIMIIKLSSSQKGTLTFDIRLNSLIRFNTSSQADRLTMKGYAPIHTEPSYRGNIPNAVIYDESKGTRFTTLVKIKNTDGSIIKSDSTIGVENGTEAIIYISIATSFNRSEEHTSELQSL